MLRGTGLVVVGWVGRLSVVEVRFLEIQVALVSFAMWVFRLLAIAFFSFFSLLAFNFSSLLLLLALLLYHVSLLINSLAHIPPLPITISPFINIHTIPPLPLLFSIILFTAALLSPHHAFHDSTQIPNLYHIIPIGFPTSLLVSCSFSILTLPHSLSRTFFLPLSGSRVCFFSCCSSS